MRSLRLFAITGLVASSILAVACGDDAGPSDGDDEAGAGGSGATAGKSPSGGAGRGGSTGGSSPQGGSAGAGNQAGTTVGEAGAGNSGGSTAGTGGTTEPPQGGAGGDMGGSGGDAGGIGGADAGAGGSSTEEPCLQTMCGGSCVDTTTSEAHCGSCDRACATDERTTGNECVASACAPTCKAGFADCSPDDGSGVDDGCETNLNANATCGTACGALVQCEAGEVCSAGACVPEASCPDMVCDSGCIDVEVGVPEPPGVDHCGDCDRACSLSNATGATCAAGACVPACSPGFADCSPDDGEGLDDGCETNLSAKATCGLACGSIVACGEAQTCEAGVCVNPNLLTSGGKGTFESDAAGWYSWTGTATASAAKARSGTGSLLATPAAGNKALAATNIASIVTPGSSYIVSAWVSAATGSAQVHLTSSVSCDDGKTVAYDWLQGNTAATDSAWVLLDGKLVVPSECTQPVIQFYPEADAADVSFHVDDVSVRAE